MPASVTVERAKPGYSHTRGCGLPRHQDDTRVNGFDHVEPNLRFGGRGLAGSSTPNSSTQCTYVVNPARDAEVDALQLRPQMRELLRAHPPPTTK